MRLIRKDPTGKKINALIMSGKYVQARRLIEHELKIDPSNAWLLTQLSTAYYEQKNYKKALEYSEKALRYAPMDPLMLWDYAGALNMLGKKKKAIDVWQRIIKRGIYSAGFVQTGEGEKWARSLLNDCRYRIGLAYGGLKKYRLAKLYINNHIKYRSSATPSIYKISEVKKSLKNLVDKRGC